MAGNALHSLFAYSHPHAEHVITTSFVLAVEDEVEAPDLSSDPETHLRLQTGKISQGQQLDRVTALKR